MVSRASSRSGGGSGSVGKSRGVKVGRGQRSRPGSRRGFSSPLNNMGDESASEKTNFVGCPAPSLSCDKLRLAATCCGLSSLDDFPILGGLSAVGRRRCRNQGDRASWRWYGHAFQSRGVDGACVVHLDCVEGQSSVLSLIFNPNKVGPADQVELGRVLARLGVDPSGETCYVDEYAMAFDYPVERRRLLLDSGTCVADQFGLTATGPQTERVGFRKGSRLRVQLYDKSAERASVGESTGGPVTRFEVTVWPRVSHPYGERAVEESIWLRELGDQPWPDTSCVLRYVGVDPDAMADPLASLAVAAARSYGVRFMRSRLRAIPGVPESFVSMVCACLVGEVDPSPASVHPSCWPAAASAAVAPLVDGYREGGGACAA